MDRSAQDGKGGLSVGSCPVHAALSLGIFANPHTSPHHPHQETSDKQTKQPLLGEEALDHQAWLARPAHSPGAR